MSYIKKCLNCGHEIKTPDQCKDKILELISNRFQTMICEIDIKDSPYNFFRKIKDIEEFMKRFYNMEEIFRYSSIDRCLEYCFDK